MEPLLNSYEKINYSLRPGKSIERKMLCEAIKNLSFIQNVKNYRYIGFGSTHFIDFSLIHRALGIKDLISIEKDEPNANRFHFNNPFSCISLLFGDANDILPKIKWNKLSIVWLDYDNKIRKNIINPLTDSNMFADIGTFFVKAKPGSVFIITVDVKPDHPEILIGNEKIKNPITEEELKKYRFDKLCERVGIEKIPVKYRDINLNKENNPIVIHKIIDNEIKEIIKRLNFGLLEEEKIDYNQLFHFLYDDGTLMLTVGGLIYNKEQNISVAKMQKHFEDLDFIKYGAEPFIIEYPQLTFKEIHLLDSFLPDRINEVTGVMTQDKKYKRNVPTLSVNDKIKYSKIYKYFPTFAETIF